MTGSAAGGRARFRPLPLAAALAALAALPGCDTSVLSAAGAGLEEGRRLTAAERARMRAVQRGEILREERPFYGAAVAAERGTVSGTPLPRALEGARGVSLSLSGQADVRAVAGAVTEATGIPVNIRERYLLPDGGALRVPIGTRMAVTGYEGPLSAFMDRLAARMDVAWSYDGRVITVDRMALRSWRVGLPLGTTSVSDGVSGGGGVTVTTARVLDPWAELEARLAPLAPPPARVTLSPQAGRVEAFGPPSVLAALDTVIRDVAETAATRIGLEIAVYWVLEDRADEFGIGVAADARIGEFGATLLAAAGGDAAGGLVISRGASTLSFEALARDGAVADYRLASSVAQPGTVTPIALTEERSYIRSVTTERGDGDNAPTVEYEIGELETGLSVAALARLVEGRRIQLALTFSQRAFRGFDADVLARTGTIQAPAVDSREIRSETVLAPGETLVLSGYEQDVAARGGSGPGFLRRIGLGGGREASTSRARMVLLVRPTLIPPGGRA